MSTTGRHKLVTLEDLDEFKSEITILIRKLLSGQAEKKHKKWLKSTEARKLIGVSPGKLQSIRESGLLPFTRIGGNIYYDEDDLYNLFNDNKNCKKSRL